MSNLINSWQALTNSLSCQLAETKAELGCTRQLNERLSKQLDVTSKQLSEAVDKFSKLQEKMQSTSDVERPPSSTLLVSPIRELSGVITDFRRWLPEGMAAAAVAAVNARFATMSTVAHRPPSLLPTPESTSLLNLYGTGFCPQPSVAYPVHLPNAPCLPPHNNELHFTNQTLLRDTNPNFYTVEGPQKSSTVSQSHMNNQLQYSKSYLDQGSNNTVATRIPCITVSKNSFSESLLPSSNAFSSVPVTTNNVIPNQFRFGQSLAAKSEDSHTAVTKSSPISAPTSLQHNLSAKSNSGILSTPLAIGNVNFNTPTSAAPSCPKLNFSFESNLKQGVSNLLTDDTDSPEKYEPHVNFKPLLEQLPDLVEVNTGEEKEDRLFVERARLYRWNKSSGNWTTRGVGEARILKAPETGKCRFVMRRDQVKKLCANHLITGDIQLNPHSNNKCLSMWAVRDYSEDKNGKDELFMIQFKTIELQDSFMKIFISCVFNESQSNVSQTPNEKSKTSEKQNDIKNEGWICKICSHKNTVTCSDCVKCKKGNSTEQPDKFIEIQAAQAYKWQCKLCLLHNGENETKCAACDTKKPGFIESSTPKPSESSTQPLFGQFNIGSDGFIFGQPKSAECGTDTSTPKALFSFTALSSKSDVTSQSTLKDSDNAVSTLGFKPSFSFGLQNKDKLQPQSLDIPFRGSHSPTTTGTTSTTSAASFTFSFGPTNILASPRGSKCLSDADSHDDNDKVELVDDSKLNFKPLLDVLPEKVEILTGEENDEVLFNQRAKLYRWDVDTWRERGIGALKLLRSKLTGSVRCIMRRDQVLKVCCNHSILPDMHLQPLATGGDRSWTWWAIDFAEQPVDSNEKSGAMLQVDSNQGQRVLFAVRFKSVEHAEEFRKVFEEAVQGSKSSNRPEIESPQSYTHVVDIDQTGGDSDSDVVVVDSPLNVTDEQIRRARELKLPDGFYAYDSGEPEQLTSKEVEEEEKLLEDAIRRYKTSNSHDKLATPTSEPTVAPASKQSLTFPLNQSTVQNSNEYVPGLKGLFDFQSLCKTEDPVWGAKTQSKPSWETTSQPLFAKSSPGTKTGNDQVSDSEEYDPHYEPIVPLPDLADVKTGEEEEICVFRCRCRAYRFLYSEWKERGTGDVKILVRLNELPTDCKFGPRDVAPLDMELKGIVRARILMRREQVLKVCMNQLITSEVPALKPMSSTGNSFCWANEDFSAGEKCMETFAIKFKLVTDASNFSKAILRVQDSLKSR